MITSKSRFCFADDPNLFTRYAELKYQIQHDNDKKSSAGPKEA